MRVLLAGATGQIGWELQRSLQGFGSVIALTRKELDLDHPERVRSAVRTARPDLIINAAAYTGVERAESDAAAAFRANAESVGEFAAAARVCSALLVHYSTDYVFDGTKKQPYHEIDPASPLNVYGKSKLAGEEAIRAAGCSHLILRTSWVYATRGQNFLLTMLRLATERTELKVVDDQHGTPTWARFAAEATVAMLWQWRLHPQVRERLVSGSTVHLTNAGEATWHEFARDILDLTAGSRSRSPAVRPIPSSEYPFQAVRPLDSRLSLDLLARDWGIEPPHWRDSLRLCLDER